MTYDGVVGDAVYIFGPATWQFELGNPRRLSGLLHPDGEIEIVYEVEGALGFFEEPRQTLYRGRDPNAAWAVITETVASHTKANVLFSGGTPIDYASLLTMIETAIEQRARTEDVTDRLEDLAGSSEGAEPDRK